MRKAAREALEYLKAMDIDPIPLSRGAAKAVRPEPPEEPRVTVAAAPAAAGEVADKKTALLSLREEMGECALCGLYEKRNNIVFGEGNPDARIMFIGEAPGREEDLQARPFVGEAGKQLTNLIEKILGLKREDVYIANICKCRPPENRDPMPAEMDACFPFINRQIRIINPGVIIALGKISTYSLMKPDYPIMKFSILRERGRMFSYNGVPVMPTTHPAYWLRNGKDKFRVVEDIRAALKKISEVR
jgi:DNA polymerase